MVDLENILLNLVKPLAADPSSISVKQMESVEENEMLFYVYAPSEDLSKLIGKKGNIANSLRQLMQLANSNKGKHISIKFETL